MNHATPEEIHDHAYGFRVSEHVAACAECRRSADAVASERETLKGALREEPMEAPMDLLVRIEVSRTQRRRFSAPALAAAALLLGTLTWMLFQPKSPVEPPETPSSSSSHEEDLEKIIEQLKSASPLKQELARTALKKYGGLAVPVLERAKADPALIDECRGFSKKDQDEYRKAQSKRMSIAWEDTPLVVAIDQIREASGLNLHISQVPDPDSVRVTLKLQNASIVEILDQLKAITKIPWGRTLEFAQPATAQGPQASYVPVYLFGVETPASPSLAPVRIRSLRPWAAEQRRKIGELKDDEKTFLLFNRLARAADPTLWDYLAAPETGVRRQAEEALRQMYAPPSQAPMIGREWNLVSSSTNLSYENKPFAEVLENLGQFTPTGGLLLDPRVDIPTIPITFKVKELSVRNTLKLLLSQDSLDYFPANDYVLVTKPEWLPFRQQSGNSLWTSVDEASTAEAVIEGLESDDPEARKQATSQAMENGRRALQWLAHASDITSKREVTDTIRSLLASLGIRYADFPGGVRDQTLSPVQSAILDRKLSLKSHDKTLEQLLSQQGLKVRLQAAVPMPLLVSSAGFKVYDLLLGVTRPLGLDFYMDGETIVVDTGANVRKAVEKK